MNTKSAVDTDSPEFREPLERLLHVLSLHVQHHRSLVEILERKKRALVEIDSAGLEKILDLEREAIGSIGAVEEERIDLTRNISRQLGQESPMRLAELVLHAGDDCRETLLDLRDELRRVACELDRLNRVNRTLSVHSLEHVNLFIAMLGGKDPDGEPDSAMPSPSSSRPPRTRSTSRRISRRGAS